MRIFDKRARNEIVKEMSLCSIEQGSTVFKQGLHGSYFYIIKEGKLDLYIDDKYVKTIGSGESIGELALMHSTERSGTVVASSKVLVWCLERRNFRKIVDVINRMNYEENKQFLSSVKMLNAIDSELKTIMAHHLLKQYYESGKFIFRGKLIGVLFECVSPCFGYTLYYIIFTLHILYLHLYLDYINLNIL